MKQFVAFTLIFALFVSVSSIKLPSSLTAALPSGIANVLKKAEAKSADSSAITVNGLQLVVGNTTASLDQATEACRNMGSSLPIIHTSEEMEAIKSAVPAGSVVWIGLTKKNNQMEWMDGSAMGITIPTKDSLENEMCTDCGFALDVDSKMLIPLNKSLERNQLCMKKKEESGGFGMKSIAALFSKLTGDIQSRIEKMRTDTEAQLNKLTAGNEGIMSMLTGQQKMMQDILAKMGSPAAEASTSEPVAATSPVAETVANTAAALPILEDSE